MPKLSETEIHERCTYHPPTELAKIAHEMVNETIEMAMLRFNLTIPDGRELSLAFTKLEEARHWANAAIARNHARLECAPEEVPV